MRAYDDRLGPVAKLAAAITEVLRPYLTSAGPAGTVRVMARDLQNVSRILAAAAEDGEPTDGAIGCGESVQFADIVVSPQTFKAEKAGCMLDLTLLEFQLAYALVLDAERVVPYHRLLECGWFYHGGTPDDSYSLKTHVSHLRRKLASVGEPIEIRPVWRIGYCLERAKVGSRV
jgi:DNA-binding response OmpR family regulator